MAVAFLFMQAGSMKLLAYPMGIPPHGGTVNLISEIGLAGILELVGGFLLFIGLFSRTTAFILSGEMAVAYFQVHFPRGWWPIMNGGIDAMLYCFVFLYFSAAGPGAWSIDSFRSRRYENRLKKTNSQHSTNGER